MLRGSPGGKRKFDISVWPTLKGKLRVTAMPRKMDISRSSAASSMYLRGSRKVASKRARIRVKIFKRGKSEMGASTGINRSTTATVANMGVMSFPGQPAPFKEKVFRAMLKPVTVMSRAFQNIQTTTSGCAAVSVQGFLRPLLSESSSPSTTNVIPQLLDLAQICTTGLADTYNTNVNPYVVGANYDGGYYIESEFVKHDIWNPTVVPYAVEFFIVEPKLENLFDNPRTTWSTACSLEATSDAVGDTAGTAINFGGNTPLVDDVAEHPTQHKYWNSCWKVTKKVKKIIAPGEHAFFYVKRGRRYVNMNHMYQGKSALNSGANPNNQSQVQITQYKSLSYYVMVRAVGLIVRNTTSSNVTTAPVDLSWQMESKYRVLPSFVQIPKTYMWGGASTTSTCERGALTNSYGFINQTTDTVVNIAGNSAAGGVDSII